MASAPAWPPRTAVRCSRVVAPRVVPVSARDLTSEQPGAGLRFPRQARLTRPRDYQRVFASARRLGDRYFTVLATPNELSHARLGLAISRRSAPRAVDRNRIKRTVRESFRHRQDTLAAVDVVVMAKPAARQATNEELFRSLEQQWRRLTKA